MSLKSPKPKFIFDANFFIALKQIRAKKPYQALAKVKKELDMDFYVSGAVFNECPFIVGSNFQEFNKGVQIELIKDDELEGVKNDLKKKGVKMMAQDPDLTLVALAYRLRKEDVKNDILIVSDDFKLSQNIDTIGYRTKCLPLPSFLQILANNTSSSQKRYWITIRKKVLRLNLDYMISRKETYPPQAKIAWLIENAVDVAGQGIHLKKNVDPKAQEDEKISKDKKMFEICQDYILEKPLNKTKRERIKPYANALKKIRKSRQILELAKDSLMQSNFKTSLKYLKKGKFLLNSALQLSGAGNLSEDKYQFVEKLLASEISKISFLRAFVFIEANKVATALNDLDDTAMFSTISRIPDTVLTINYIKALVYVFNGIYNKSVKQFDFIQKLANAYGDKIIQLKATIGETIILFLTDKKEEAFQKVESNASTIKEREYPHLMNALIDSGDYFLAMGFPEIATNLYMKSLELAVDSHKQWKTDFILNKMQNSFMSSALVGTETRPVHQIAGLIDKWHDLKNINDYNEIMNKFTKFTNKLYEPFDYFTPKNNKFTTYYDLPEDMKYEWKCVKIYENEKSSRTLLIGYKEEIGLVGFDVLTDQLFEAVPENYSIEINKKAKIKIEPPEPDKMEHLLCRAIIKVGDQKRDITINRKIPVFFKQLNL